MKTQWGTTIGILLALAATPALGVTAAEKCQAGKLKIAGKYDFCRLRAEAKAAQTGFMPDFSMCDATFADKWGSTEIKGGGMCPSNGDQADIGAFITQHTDDLAAALAGGKLPPRLLATGQTTSYGAGSDGDLQKGAARSFTDNGDGTITDNLTGLMWEKKSDDGTIHDKDNIYTWCQDTTPSDGSCDTAGNPMDGTMMTTFLASLNGGGGFAGYTDWRIPNRFELESLLELKPEIYLIDSVFTGCAAGCTVTMCSCTNLDEAYWSSSTAFTFDPFDYSAWSVMFNLSGDAIRPAKSVPQSVRAVRGGT